MHHSFIIFARESKICLLKGRNLKQSIIDIQFDSSKYFQGNEEGAIKILQKIYKMNTGDREENLKVKKLIEDPEFSDDFATTDNSEHPLVLMWKQIIQLLSKKYISKTFIACLMQFSIYLSMHGLYMFFPELIDEVSKFKNENPDGKSTMCQIYEKSQSNSSNSDEFNAVSCLIHFWSVHFTFISIISDSCLLQRIFGNLNIRPFSFN